MRDYDEQLDSPRAIAELFGISRSFIEKLLARRRSTGEIAPLPRGQRVVGNTAQNYGQNITMLAALSATGVEAMRTVEGATDGDSVPHLCARGACADTLRSGLGEVRRQSLPDHSIVRPHLHLLAL